MRYPILFLLLCCTSLLSAADPIILIYPDGYYLLQGKQVVPARVIDLTGGTTPPTDPDQPPPPPPPVDNSQLSYEWAKAVGDTVGAQVLAITYRQVAGVLPNSTNTLQRNIEALSEATDISLNLVGTKAQWSTYRKNFADLINKQLPTLDNAKLATLLNEFATGLERFAQGAAPVDPKKILPGTLQINELLGEAQ